ncbi:hypothetical protein M6B38_264030 [Iris pallida]|uniref:Uncharacterized protein n=1 Tax=Iris pallida TaxID=29817 RepID=A0AAX6IC54_IRIPA|nr:hypothetical protein M6B38_264030 [Iris pallida]
MTYQISSEEVHSSRINTSACISENRHIGSLAGK